MQALDILITYSPNSKRVNYVDSKASHHLWYDASVVSGTPSHHPCFYHLDKRAFVALAFNQWVVCYGAAITLRTHSSWQSEQKLQLTYVKVAFLKPELLHFCE
jgi:hypothetical protein